MLSFGREKIRSDGDESKRDREKMLELKEEKQFFRSLRWSCAVGGLEFAVGDETEFRIRESLKKVFAFC